MEVPGTVLREQGCPFPNWVTGPHFPPTHAALHPRLQ